MGSVELDAVTLDVFSVTELVSSSRADAAEPPRIWAECLIRALARLFNDVICVPLWRRSVHILVHRHVRRRSTLRRGLRSKQLHLRRLAVHVGRAAAARRRSRTSSLARR